MVTGSAGAPAGTICCSSRLGTGTYKKTFTSAAEQGVRSLQSLMDDCARMNRCMLQWLTKCVTPWEIDRAVQKMQIDSRGGPQLATYARYDVLLEPGWLKTEVAINQTAANLEKIAQMDDPSSINQLAEIGRIAAAKQVQPGHFPAIFDVR